MNNRISRYEWLLRLVLFLSLMRFPGKPGTNLDPSWAMVLDYSHSHGLQFGTDIIFTYGPLGYLYASQIAAQDSFWSPVLFSAVFTLFLIYVLVWFFRNTSGWRKWVAAIPLVLMGSGNPGSITDSFFFFFLLGCFFILLLDDGCDPIVIPANLRLLLGAMWGILFLVKFSFLIAGGTLYLLFLGFCAQTKRWKSAWNFSGGLVAAFLIGWVISGQYLIQLPRYFSESLHIASGYTPAMALYETSRATGFGLACLLLNLGIGVLLFLQHRKSAPGFFLPLGYLSMVFFIWKAGFTRCDTPHILIFFMFNLFLGALILSLPPDGKEPRFAHAILGIAIIGLSLPAGIYKGFDSPSRLPARILSNARDSITMLLRHSNLYPGEKPEAPTGAQDAKHWETRKFVGDGTVDVFGYDQAVAINHGFNYTPRPVFQSYFAYNHHLQQKNLAFYRASSPEWVLFALQTIDARYPTMDDALLLRYLLYNYHVSGENDSTILLKKNGASAHFVTDTLPLFTGKMAFGDVLDLAGWNANILWAQIKFTRTPMGKLSSLFYKPPRVLIHVSLSNGETMPFRLIPNMSASGFLINPLILNNDEIADLFKGMHGRKVTGFKITVDERFPWRSFSNQVEVSLHALPGIASHRQ